MNWHCLEHCISFVTHAGTPYEGGLFEVDIQVPDRYPFMPLKMKVGERARQITKIAKIATNLRFTLHISSLPVPHKGSSFRDSWSTPPNFANSLIRQFRPSASPYHLVDSTFRHFMTSWFCDVVIRLLCYLLIPPGMHQCWKMPMLLLIFLSRCITPISPHRVVLFV